MHPEASGDQKPCQLGQNEKTQLLSPLTVMRGRDTHTWNVKHDKRQERLDCVHTTRNHTFCVFSSLREHLVSKVCHAPTKKKTTCAQVRNALGHMIHRCLHTTQCPQCATTSNVGTSRPQPLSYVLSHTLHLCVGELSRTLESISFCLFVVVGFGSLAFGSAFLHVVEQVPKLFVAQQFLWPFYK